MAPEGSLLLSFLLIFQLRFRFSDEIHKILFELPECIHHTSEPIYSE
jgi:hypothetical protein